ncbi:M48 family peptidase [Burkholderia glumae]|uniref:M48 family metallopeptidase n=1 Tax=Burkholderia glumae TaxID=337 RepID=UPI000F5EC939|nr:M48 family metallopeptidase [Burkholderia glumae]MCQ0031750.1 M48 family metallopeptidase [Burkholderia glumae]MCQ0039375.1 M48 family metallopeptidase [Burkholderia glumae]QJW80462.1 M48 family metallopeptidase [Burkholderia glumae]RQZ66401.1 peptidase [Burkholderia glumae]UVS84275.1 M48 family peptidase [Burkholderia glumae]
MSASIHPFRNKREKPYQWAMIVIGVLLWIAIAQWLRSHWYQPKFGHVIRLYAGYAMVLAIGRWLAGGAYRATAFGNMVLVGPSQFPALHAMVVEASREIGLSEPPRTFIHNANGVFNAFARRLFGGRYVFLTAALVEANNDAQVRFVIGHELGHHAAGHLNPWLNALRLPAHLVPFLGKAYSRSREYTCDSIGAYLAKDAAASRGALQMLGCGCRRLNGSMNCEAFVAQEQQVPPIFGFLTEINRSHPRLTRRVAAIHRGTTHAGAAEAREPQLPTGSLA